MAVDGGVIYNAGGTVTVSDSQFVAWIHGQRREFAPATGKLPPYNQRYLPSPQRRAG